MYNQTENNWHITQSSNCLITTARENRIKEVFHSLSNPPHTSLHHSHINFSALNDVQRIFIPVFQEMVDIDTDLTKE
jgi:hypothetical protein